MIIAQEKTKQVVQSHDFAEVNCTIDAEDMRYVASLLRNNYSNPALAVVREISANALDANTEANSTRQIEITMPTSMNPNFSVRDFGGGLSEEDVFGLYSKYGKSTKRTSNNYIGAFGIGKFAPLSYGDNFTCVSYHKGNKTTYNIFVNDDDDTKIVRIGEPEPTNEPTGLLIQVAVAEGDRDNFNSIAHNFFKFFNENDMPKFKGVEEDFIIAPKISIKANDDSWFFTEDEERGSYYSYNHASYQPKIIMGRVSYPLDRSSIVTDKFFRDDKKKRMVDAMLQASNFHLCLPLGSVKLHHSREMLEYNESTQRVLCKYLNKVVEEVKDIAQAQLADSADLFEAKKNYAKIINSMPYGCREIFNNAFAWKGIEISDASFARPHDMYDDLIITEFSKDSDEKARDGYRVKSSKTNRVYCQENSLVMIQNLESAHGNNLRVRTLFEQDSELSVVYVVRANTDSADNVIWTQWRFDKINDKNIRYTSNVEKQKPIRSGVRKSNGGRANIPLFVMRINRGLNRNADYWENASSELLEIEDGNSVDGNYEGKLIYVPIKNFKINIESTMSFELEAMRSRLLKINHAHEDYNFKLFGIRQGDVKKLDSNLWIDFVSFYKLICKKILTDNIEEAHRVNTARSIETHADFRELERSKFTLCQIFSASNLDIKSISNKNSLFFKTFNLYNKYHDSSSSMLVFLNFLKSECQDWVDENLNQEVTFEEYKSHLNDCAEKYPMVSLLGLFYNAWRNEGMPHSEQLKIVEDYIALADKA